MNAANQYIGKCVRGPHDGQMKAHWSKILTVRILHGTFIQTGHYEWFDGVWIWAGIVS